MDPVRIAALIEEHSQLVEQVAYAVATRVAPQVEYEALRQAARAGLVEAAHLYPAESGISFAWWARCHMRGAVLNQLRSGTSPKHK